MKPFNKVFTVRRAKDSPPSQAGQITLERIEPRPDLDPLTGHPWAFPWAHYELTREQFEARFGAGGESPLQAAVKAIVAPPPSGTKAADLTERDKLALCIAASAPIEVTIVRGNLTVKTLVPCGVADRGDGGYIVAVGPPEGSAPSVTATVGHEIR